MVLMMSFLSLSRLSKKNVQIAQVKTENPHGKIKSKEKRRAFSPWRSTYNLILFRNGSRNGGPDPWQGSKPKRFKPKGLEESLYGVSRSSRDHLGPHRFGVSPGLPTGLPGMERDSQLLQKALDKNQRGVFISCFLLLHPWPNIWP